MNEKMTQIDAWIEGKKVLLLGFGREGQSTYRMLARTKRYASLTIADQNTEKAWLPDPDVSWIVGPDYQKTLDEYDVVFKSPGIVLERPVTEYRCSIISQTEVFFQLFRDQIVGITGTKGKSTTTSLLYHILKEAGRKTMIAGNIGIPAFDHMDEVEPDTVIVFEMSCHQLEYMTVSPHVGVLLNIHEEHLDHYGTMEKYTAAKEKIFRNQKPEDILICGQQCLPRTGECPSHLIAVRDLGEDEDGGAGKPEGEDVLLKGKRIFQGDRCFVIPEEEIHLLGHHNYFDIAAVYAVCRLLGIGEEDFLRGLKSFRPLPHRLYYLGTKDGVRYYDDSISTICDTTIQALNTLKDADTVLIGGMDRGIDYQDLIRYLSGSPVENIILMEATGERIFREIRDKYPGFKRPERLIPVEHLEDAVREARRRTRKGCSCVLSPAAASYGIFKNFEERGEVFARLVFENL